MRSMSPPASASIALPMSVPSAAAALARRVRTRPLAYCSQQPMLPHSHGRPSGTTCMCPNSPGDAELAAIGLTVDDECAADAGAEGDEHEVGLALRCAEAPLGPAAGVGVVVDHHRQSRTSRDRVAQRLVAPGEVRREQHGRLGRVDESRCTDADGGDVVLAAKLLGDLGDRVDHGGRLGGRRLALAAGRGCARPRRRLRRRSWCRRCRCRSPACRTSDGFGPREVCGADDAGGVAEGGEAYLGLRVGASARAGGSRTASTTGASSRSPAAGNSTTDRDHPRIEDRGEDRETLADPSTDARPAARSTARRRREPDR